jgi:FkbM family methyltransferase
MIFYSQSKQDKWVLQNLSFKNKGIFIDIGAYDGIQTSNTYVLEKDYNWSGICIEANSDIYQRLIKNRNCTNIYGAVSNYNGDCYFSSDKITNEGVKTPCFLLNDILEKNLNQNVIDYLSIDVEGHEFSILETIDFDKWKFKLLTVEHNLYCNGSEQKNKIFDLLSKKGYTRVVEDAVCLDTNPTWNNKPYEDWYVNSDFTFENKIWKQSEI